MSEIEIITILRITLSNLHYSWADQKELLTTKGFCSICYRYLELCICSEDESDSETKNENNS